MSGRADPLVSVIVCVYNAGPYLRPAVESLLLQTYSNLEILLVNDGSTDGCVDSLADIDDPRLRIIHQQNKGKPAAMNLALDEARGHFYAISDADDLSHPQRIAKQVAAMKAYPDVAAVYCGHELIIDDRQIAPTFRAKDFAACRRDIDRFLMPAHDPTGMYRISSVGDVRYDPHLPIVEGFDYMLRVGERSPMMVLGECLYTYRIHWESVTKKNPALRNRLVLEVLRRACARRGLDFEACLACDLQQRTGGTNAERDNGIAAHCMESACDLKHAGRRWEALRVGLQCVRLHPFDFHYHKALIYAATPCSFMTGSRRLQPGAR